MIKISELPIGAILWFDSLILGIKGVTLDNTYDEYYATKLKGNRFDYKLESIGLPDNLLHELVLQLEMEQSNMFEEIEDDEEDDWFEEY